MTKKLISHMLNNNIGVLQHFIEEGAWPIRERLSTKEMNASPWLCYTSNGHLARNLDHEIPAELLAAYWKYRFDETLGDYVKLANALEEVTKLL